MTHSNGHENEMGADEVYGKGQKLFERERSELERKFWGQYVVFNLKTEQYIIAPSLSTARKEFISKYGQAEGWCSRIGIPILAH